jgi:hypothetical protein
MCKARTLHKDDNYFQLSNVTAHARSKFVHGHGHQSPERKFCTWNNDGGF